MEEILTKAIGTLAMILLKDPHPILTVRILRATLCLASLITLVGLAGYVLHLLIEWFA